MAVLSRYRTATGAGVLTALVLVLVFGSPWYRNWAADHTNPDTAGGWFLRLLGWPAWRFDSNDTFGDVLADDLKAILLIVLTGVFLMLTTGQQLARARGTLSQFFAGWSAYIFAAALAALLTTFIRSNPSLLAAFQSAGNGALYGLFTGWIIGITTLGHWRGTT
ncbi:MAG: hypothetical protein HOV71_22755 [Hamadaea sp.]|nr:hypothetical protein [Hamadaea sp.]NUR50957.1 hypothetical protein [Hamadaea sp.]NUT07193.1 hypothetical protein [Hamadaea sp.]